LYGNFIVDISLSLHESDTLFGFHFTPYRGIIFLGQPDPDERFTLAKNVKIRKRVPTF
jgi:hypothetical protein